MSLTFEAWLTYLETLHPKTMDLGLSRILPLARKLELTNFPAKVITVAGTNGKGSLVKTLSEFYLQAGYTVASYTSPHLMHFTERLLLSGRPFSPENWITAFEKIELAREKIELTFFEFTTLAALWLCKVYKPEVMVLEIGLGGREDAVNVVEPGVSVITTIDLDHQAWLGNTREKIAFEKAGIFRAGKPAVCGDPNPPNTLIEQASKLGVQLHCLDKSYTFSICKVGWQFKSEEECLSELPLPKLELQNVATALMAAKLTGLPIAKKAIVEVMPRLFLPGRYECINESPKTILDVAHNPQAARLLASKIIKEKHLGKIYAIVGMLSDKEYEGVLQPFHGLVSQWVAVTLAVPSSLNAQFLTSHLTQKGLTSSTAATVLQALGQVYQQCSSEDLVLVFGSFHMVCAAKEALPSLRGAS